MTIVVKITFLSFTVAAISVGLGGCCHQRSCQKEKTYCVIDLAHTTKDGKFPVSWLDEVPSGGWSVDHKTRMLVLRRIPPGRFRLLGKYDTEVSRPFYIGVFEFTCAQYEFLTGKSVESFTTRIAEDQPLGDMTWEEVCGGDADVPIRDGPVAGVDGFSIPRKDSLLGLLSRKTGRRFSLPTESQWEYACRAGIDAAYNIGGGGWDSLRECGCSRIDLTLKWNGAYPITHVGNYLPNRWGLYDMHGNLEEMCLDIFANDEALHAAWGNGAFDPCFNGGTDPEVRGWFVTKGGSFRSLPSECTTTSRKDRCIQWPEAFVGFRVVMEAEGRNVLKGEIREVQDQNAQDAVADSAAPMAGRWKSEVGCPESGKRHSCRFCIGASL